MFPKKHNYVIIIKLITSMLMTSLLGLLTPLAAYTSIWAIFALRVAQVVIVLVVILAVVVLLNMKSCL